MFARILLTADVGAQVDVEEILADLNSPAVDGNNLSGHSGSDGREDESDDGGELHLDG